MKQSLKNWLFKNNKRIFSLKSTLSLHAKGLFALYLLLEIPGSAQVNLVPNPSFESFTSCPTNYSQLSLATPWIAPTNNNSDLFNTCGSSIVSVPSHDGAYGFQNPLSGNGYAGFWVYNGIGSNYREYMQVQLTDTLQTTKCYYVEFYTNLENGGITYAVNNIGINFSDTSTLTTGTGFVLNLVPQILQFQNKIITDTLNWTRICGVYTANGGEKFITIGNFFDDISTDTLNTGNGWYQGAYYYIDNVSVVPIDSILSGMPAFAGNDTSLIAGDSVFIGQQISNLNCNWYNSSGTLIASNISGIYVQPITDTYYVVEQNLCGNITSDTVNVNVTGVGINESEMGVSINLYPNPTPGEFTIELNGSEAIQFNIQIVDMQGRSVYSETSTSHILKLKPDADNGVYLVHITNITTNDTFIKKLVIQK